MKCTLETNSCTKELYDGAAGCICLEHGADASNDVRVFSRRERREAVHVGSGKGKQSIYL